MRHRPLVQLAANAVAATFLLAAVLGFTPGITSGYDGLSLAGNDSS